MSELASAPTSNGSPQPEDHDSELNAFLRPLHIDDNTVHSLAFQFSKVYKRLALDSDEQFLPTPVTELPTGRETGRLSSQPGVCPAARSHDRTRPRHAEISRDS